MPPAHCSLCCSCRPPEGANKRQPVVCPVIIYQLSAPQGSAAATRARKVQHAGSLGRARRLAQRPGPARGERGGQRAARRPSREPIPAFSWSDAVPRSLIPMHRLILVYTLVCANFCSYRDTSAAPQSASIKALRNANLRRDGKGLRFYFLIKRCLYLLSSLLSPPPPFSLYCGCVWECVCVCVFVGGSPALSPALREPLLPEWD